LGSKKPKPDFELKIIQNDCISFKKLPFLDSLIFSICGEFSNLFSSFLLQTLPQQQICKRSVKRGTRKRARLVACGGRYETHLEPLSRANLVTYNFPSNTSLAIQREDAGHHQERYTFFAGGGANEVIQHFYMLFLFSSLRQFAQFLQQNIWQPVPLLFPRAAPKFNRQPFGETLLNLALMQTDAIHFHFLFV
jgi:hypothetical protein